MPPIALPLSLEGVVCTGLGAGAQFTTLDWVVDECREKLGFIPWPGTFNVRTQGALAGVDRTRLLRSGYSIRIRPAPGYCAAECLVVNIAGRISGAVLFPEVPGYPDGQLEIIAPVPVRRTLGLNDGDRVNLSIGISTSLFCRA
ncbi:DUF120 domain-containing protein [Thauera aromatica]|uniref:Riboflavin kinase n=2 Tax=Thauera aromatica TaxID=59405 RepID=A0A2R4BQQ1_THAAR|nr:DUF120 domain-containing protein [Thauera aromatica]AVR89665.1 riboflavin kinase [Thauera aromatica K172]CAC12693.1 hypothetical protein [Thauera aromatica]